MEKNNDVYVLFQHEENAICDCGGLPYISAIWFEKSITGELHLWIEERCFDCDDHLDLTDFSLSGISIENQEKQ